MQSEIVKNGHTHTSSAFFAIELHRDSPVVTSGELHQTCEHQVASVEVLMEFNVSSCLGAPSLGWSSRPQFT